MSNEEKISLAPLLPRGSKAELARKYNLSKTAIKHIADGINTNYPEIYSEMLVLAEQEKEVRAEREKLNKENAEKAKQLACSEVDSEV